MSQFASGDYRFNFFGGFKSHRASALFKSLATGLVLTAASASQLAFSQVVIDDWIDPTDQLAAAPGPVADTDAQALGTIVGGTRHVIAARVGGTLTFNAEAGGGVLTHNAGTTNAGRTTVIWDGRALGGGSTDRTVVNPLGLGSVNVDLGDGLEDAGDEDLTLSCSANARAITFQAVGDNTHPIEVEVRVWTNANRWSTGTVFLPTTDEVTVVSIPFGDFVPGGIDGGAVFTNVGAIRLTTQSQPAQLAADISIQSAVTNCGFDFGDAPEEGLGGFYYTTSLGERPAAPGDIENNTFPGPAHRIGGPFIGSGSNDTDAESDGNPTTDALGDDTTVSDDEESLSFPLVSEAGTPRDADCDGLINDGDTSLYCVAVPVVNPTDNPATLVGWIDFSGNGVFDVAGCGTSTDGVVVPNTIFPPNTTILAEGEGCDRSAETLRLGPSAGTCGAGSPSGTSIQLANTSGNDDWSDGNVPANCEGTVVLVWDLSEYGNVNPSFVAQMATGQTFARIRISTDTESTLFSTTAPGPAPYGIAGDGEVEDHELPAGTLPVSIHSFDSRFTENGLVIEWGTVSETRNSGFHIWADFGKGVELVNERQIQSVATDIATPERYEYLIPDVGAGDVVSLAVTGVDYEGKEEVYGLFTPGDSYGAKSDPAPLAWDSIGMAVSSRLQERVARDGKSGASSAVRGPGNLVDYVDFQASAAGIHSITGQQLADAGLNLTGVDASSIAITLKGQPVARHIVTPTGYSAVRRDDSSGAFGVNSEIRFWAEKPALPDALYLDNYVYRVEVDRSKAAPAAEMQTKPKPGVDSYVEWVRQDLDETYNFASPLQDPWYAAVLRAGGSSSRYETTVLVDDDFLSGEIATLKLVIGGLTNVSASPNHHVRVELNGQMLDEQFFTGSVELGLELEVPAGLLQPGENTVAVSAPGGTDATIDMMLVDKVELGYARKAVARNDRMLVEAAGRDGGLTVTGFQSLDTVAYAWADGQLTALRREQFSRGSVRIPTLIDGARYWISTRDSMHRPTVTGSGSRSDLLAGVTGDFLVIAHPAFMPLAATEMHPLNDFMQQRESDGWQPVLFDITEIQAQYGDGMALPDALTAFLAEADQRMTYEHVLLVGSDNYDYTDNLGIGSVSFIPTRYAATSKINHTPSDALLADLDGDGLADKSIGRWPVRTFGDLQAIVSKTLTWDGTTSDMQNAVWVSDSDEQGNPAFTTQANRMAEPLLDAGWPQESIDRVYFDEVDPAPGMSIADTARMQFFDLLEQGRALTGFVGHGAPTMWTFQGLLTPNDLSDLHNEGAPTLIGTMTCYTSYFVSPVSDSVAHRWMNGYREDGAGARIEGIPNGSVAIHGAATLSNYAQNEVFVRNVLELQLQGKTLGEAVEGARQIAAGRSIGDLVINWTLLGDPTLRLQ